MIHSIWLVAGYFLERGTREQNGVLEISISSIYLTVNRGMCMCVCMYVYMYMCVYIYIYVCIYYI